MAPSVAAPVPPAPVAPLTTPADVPPNGDVGRKRDQNVQPAAAASAALPASPANKGAAADPNNDVPPTPYDKPPTEKDGAPSPRDTEAATAAAAPAPAPAAAPSAALQPVPDSTCEAKGTARPTKQAPAGSSTPTQRSPVVQAASAAAPIPWSVHQLLYRRPGPLQLRGIVDTNVFERNMPLLMDMVAACKKDIKECKLLLPIQVKEELQAHKRPINGKKQQLQNDAGLALYHITEARKDGVLEEQAEHDLPKKHLKDGTRRMSGDLGILQAMGFALDKGQVPFLVSDDKLLRLLVINYGFRAYASSVFERTALPVLDLQGPDAFFDWLA